MTAAEQTAIHDAQVSGKADRYSVRMTAAEQAAIRQLRQLAGLGGDSAFCQRCLGCAAQSNLGIRTRMDSCEYNS